MTTTLTVSFQIKILKLDKKNLAPIYCRITLNGTRKEFSIGRSVDPNKWNKIGLAKGTTEEARSINAYLTTIRLKLNEHHRQVLESGKPLSAEYLLACYMGKTEKVKTFVELFQFHNDQMKTLIGKDFSKATYTKYCTTMKHLKNFIRWRFNQDDIELTKLNYAFVADFDFYLKTEVNCAQNATMKYIRNLKKILNIAVENQWLPSNPFNGFKIRYEKADREYLTEDELNALMKKDFSIQRLAQVRDIFVFACFTGVAFKDLKGLTRQNITTGIDGKKYLTYTRVKTNVSARIPLLPIPQSIIEKYQNHPPCVVGNKLLPLPSNQKMNAYLKEIADICGINKNLTTHMARHTFATTVTLTNNVPLETVSRMLGHTNIKTTQIYARVIDKKVEQDMSHLYAKYQTTPAELREII